MKKGIVIIGTLIGALGLAKMFDENEQDLIYIKGEKYKNQNIIIPKEYIGQRINKNKKLEIYKVEGIDLNEAVAVELNDRYYFYKTKNAREVFFY